MHSSSLETISAQIGIHHSAGIYERDVAIEVLNGHWMVNFEITSKFQEPQ